MALIRDIQDALFTMQDVEYRDFQSKLIPTLDPASFIGVRTAQLRSFAKQLMRDGECHEFLNQLPHRYFDENQLHAFMISEIRDFDTCVEEVDRFLPYVDNWATCDQMSPRVFKNHKEELLASIHAWICSDETYTLRFAIEMLMKHFLNEDYDLTYPEMVAQVTSGEYYVRMMVAWYFATALASQYETILPYFEGRRLEAWTHRKAIQKAVESYRITAEQKAYLKTLRG